MNWFRQNPFWGAFAAIGGGSLLVALGLLWFTWSSYGDAASELHTSADAKQQLEASNPYPSISNVRKMKEYAGNYEVALAKMKTDLAAHVLPAAPLLPNEFQTRLQQSIASVAENARVNRVTLPANFKMGFDEYASTLPTTEEAPKLGRELAQVQALLNLVIDARVDAVSMFHRGISTAVKGAEPPTPTPRLVPGAVAGPKPVPHTTVEFTVAAPPSAIRRIVNRIASAEEQFFIIRTLHVKSQKDKGPPREGAAAVGGSPIPQRIVAAPAVAGASPSSSPPAAINFIVGNEHVDFSARVELVDFPAP